MLLCFLFAAAALLAYIVFTYVDLDFKVELSGVIVSLKVEVFAPLRLVSLRIEAVTSLNELRDGAYIAINGKSKKIKKKKNKSGGGGIRIIRGIIKEAKFERILVGGKLCLFGDACGDTLLAGFLNAAVCVLLCGKCGGAKPESHIMPVYGEKTLWLYMEGILKIRLAQIIAVTIKNIVKGRRKQHGTSNRKHNENHNGKLESNG